MALQKAPPLIRPVPTVPAGTPVAGQRIRLWDLPLRIFHWGLLLAVSVAIATGLSGGDWMEVHGLAGLSIVGLLAFRLSWGLWGSATARFGNFLPTPRSLLDYLRGRWSTIGHNPLGALSVVALLGVLAAQSFTGLFGNDEIAFTGPLAGLVEEELSLALTGGHHRLINALYALLGLHLLAIAFYTLVKKEKLVRPMVTGWKEVAKPQTAPRQAGPLALVASLLLALAAVYAANGSWAHEEPAPGQASEASATETTTGAAATPAAPAPAW